MVHAMITRVYAAGLAVVLCVGSVLAPSEALARFGGFGGRAFGFSPGFHAPGLRTPFLAHPFLAHPFLAHRRAFAFDRFRRQDTLVPLTVLGGAGLYGPSDYVDPYPQPVAIEQEVVTGAIPGGGGPVFVVRPGCRTQTVTVPSEAGGHRSINITRCY
jgi:hypothetical protein